MNREILFKAKPKNWRQQESENYWVEGYYAQLGTGDNIVHYICQNMAICKLFEKEENNMYFTDVEIDPSTLCQFIGMTDKNGNKIWENDIALTQEFYDKPYAKNRKSKKHIGIVKYDIYSGNFYNNETGKYDKRKEYDAKWSIKVKDYGKFIHSSWGDFFDCEVIGNVFDNPELLQ